MRLALSVLILGLSLVLALPASAWLRHTRSSGGSCTPSLAFNTACNSQYLGVLIR